MQKIIKLDKDFKALFGLNLKSKKVVLLGGCFDILHIGHVYFLKKAKENGDIVVVLLESDETIRAKKGKKRPFYKQEDRAKVLLELRSVDYVILLPKNLKDSDYDLLVKKIKPAIIATTKGDFFIDHKERQAKLVKAKILQVNKIKDSSTTNVAKLLEKEI